MVTIDDTFGGWAKAQKTHFVDDRRLLVRRRASSRAEVR
jgi:ABC-type sulfate transport system substrate-binding protein